MSYQRRIILTYSVFVGLLALVIGFIFQTWSSQQYLRRASDNLRSTAVEMRVQIETLLHPMDFVAVNVLSNADVLNALSSLMKLDRMDSGNAGFLNEARETIKEQLYNYSLNRNFHRVSVFNEKGDFFSSYFDAASLNGSRAAGVIETLSWMERADQAEGRFVLIAPERDPWLFDREERVFRMARAIQYPKPGTGYIEVQNDESLLADIFSSAPESARYALVLDSSGTLFWSDLPEPVQASVELTALGMENPEEVRSITLAGSDAEYLAAKSESAAFGLQIYLLQERSVVLKPVYQTGLFTVLTTLLILLVSIFFIYFSAHQLTRPIRELRDRMEDTEIVNLMEAFDTQHANNEIEALNTSFQNLRLRLNDALMREIRANSLQMEASLDSLQAHVNPHFIYNILNVLSNKSLTTGDEEIGEICGGISEMLRYSTNTNDRAATVEEELRHVGNYLLLMKKRFEHKLEYVIDVSPEILSEPIPKIILQQIAENALNHGYVDIQVVMRISIRGYARDNRWYMEISDNGQGFAPEVLTSLEEKMREMHDSLFDDKRRRGFHIGGMGLVNTYARLVLFYGDELSFAMENGPEGGALVRIGSRMQAGHGENGGNEGKA